MTVNSQRLAVLQQSLETLFAEKHTLNSKVVSDSFTQFKNCITKTKGGHITDVKPAIKRLEQSLRNEGSYKNVKPKFEQIKLDILELVDHDGMKATRNVERSQSPLKQDKYTMDTNKSGTRARTVTLSHAQERQIAKSRGIHVTPVIKRPVIHTESYSTRNYRTPAIDSSNGRGTPDELVGLNKTISRLFDHLEIDKPKHGHNLSTQKETSKSKTSKIQTKGMKSVGSEETKDVKTLFTKLKLFEDEFQKRRSTQEETFNSLKTEVERLQIALVKKEQELDRMRGTHSIAQKAKGKAVERMAEIHEHEKRDMVVKLQTLELNIKKNIVGTVQSTDETRHRQVLDNISTEIIRVFTIVNKRNKLHRTRSESSNLARDKDRDNYEDLLPRIISLGEEIQMLQKTKLELSRDNNDLQIWKTSFAEVAFEVDSLWKDVYSNTHYPDVRHMSKSVDSPISKSGPIKAKLATAKALIISNSKKLEEAERKILISENLGPSNSNEILKKLTEDLNKLQTDYHLRFTNSRLSLRSISTSKSDENQETSEMLNSVKNIRKLLQDYESRAAENEKVIKEHDNDLEILRNRIVKLGAGVLNDDNVHEADNELDNKQPKKHMFSEKLHAMMKKLEIFDERLKQLQDQNKIFKRQLEGNDAANQRLAFLGTDIHELCNILKVPDTERNTESTDKWKTQLRLCKNISRKLTDDKENVERKLAKAIIDVTEITKHVATLHHHVRKICHKSDDRRKSDPHVIQTAIEEAQQKLNEITQNFDELSMENDEFKRKCKGSADDLSRLAQKIHQLRYEIEGHTSEQDRPNSAEYNYLADMEAIKQNLWKAIGERKGYVDTIDEKSKQITDLKDQLNKLQVQVKVRENAIKEKNNEIYRLTETTTEFGKDIKQLQDHIEKLAGEKRQLEKESENVKSSLEKATKDLKGVEQEKTQLLRRLSKAMGDKMTDGNTAVANLSDPNRPEKMAERFSQLYDDEWTAAYEILTNMFVMDEKMAVDCLSNVVLESFRFCLKLAEGQITDATRVLLMIHKDGFNEIRNPEKIHSINPEDKKQIRETRKLMAKYSASTVIGLYQATENKGYITEEQVEQCEQFVNKCVELCWLMAVSDPPVYMLGDLKSGELIDTNQFKFFTKSGEFSEYVVWPALLLHKHGPVICKGVVQAI